MINRRTIMLFARIGGLREVAIKGQQHVSRFVRHSTRKKLANWLLAKTQRILRIAQVRGYPYHYVIDPINICILHCPLCPTGRGTLKRSRGKMALVDFNKVVDEIAEYAYSIDLYNWGEPFLHPQVFDMIEYASARNIGTKISTNLNYFNEQMASRCIESGLEQLVLSLDGADQQTYEAYRVGGNLDRVLRNLKILVEAKKARGSLFPIITVRVLLNRHNETQIPEIRQLARRLGVDNVVIAPILVDTDKPEDVEEWLPSDQSRSYYDYASGEDKTFQKREHCPYLWQTCVLSWNGGVSPCCWYDDPTNDFGNVRVESIGRIWNNEFYVSSRQLFRGERPEKETVCTRCRGRPKYQY